MLADSKMNLIVHARNAAAKVKIPQKLKTGVIGEIEKGFYFHAVAVSSPGDMQKKSEYYRKAAEVFAGLDKKFPFRIFRAYANQYNGYKLVVEAGKATGNKTKIKFYKKSSYFFGKAAKLFVKGRDYGISKGWSKLTAACSQDALASSVADPLEKKAAYKSVKKNAVAACAVFKKLRVKKLEKRSESLIFSARGWMAALGNDSYNASRNFILASKCIEDNPEWSSMATFLMAWSKWFAAQTGNSEKNLAEAADLFGRCGCHEMELNCGKLVKNIQV